MTNVYHIGNLDELLEEMLLKGYSKVISSEEKILKSLDGLGLKEFNTLDAIWELTKNKNNTSNNLAKVLGVPPGTIPTNLDRLCEKGLVFKQKNDMDKRLVFVSLTPLGVAVRKKRENAHKKILNQAIGRLSDAEKVALTSLVNKLDL